MSPMTDQSTKFADKSTATAINVFATASNQPEQLNRVILSR